MSSTDEWAQFSIAGPRSRDTLVTLVDPPFSIANSDFPYMAVAELTICGGVKARLYRLSFSGELAYEIGVPARYGEALARELMAAGAPFGICPYGTEALGVMRIEKGHVAGNEIDGRTTAADLGFAKMMSTKKDFVGRVMAQRTALMERGRMQIVGVRPQNPGGRLFGGAHLLSIGASLTAANDQGVITSVAFSPSVNHWVGIALLVDGAARHGDKARMADLVRDAFVDVEICSPVFVDPKGERLRA